MLQGLLACAMSTQVQQALAEPPNVGPAGAGQPVDVPPVDVPPIEEPDERPDHGYWSTGEPRWFVAARPELGMPYVRPSGSLGYGMPHWFWAGVDVGAIVTPEMAQAYAGLRAATPIFDLAFGVRDTWSFDKHLLRPRARFIRADVLTESGARAHYWAWEAEAVAIVPLPHAALVVDLITVNALDLPDDRYVYDEAYRVVVADAFFMTLRIAAVARLLPEQSLRAGILVEHVFETGRPATVLRAGPLVSMQLTDQLEAIAGVTFAISSPDSLGLLLSTFGIAGLRWRWASGEPRPEVPWRGHFIPW